MIKIPNLENNSFNRLFLFIFTLVVLVVSMLTPPFQSPDEPVHLSRAYSVATGQIILKGGQVDIDKNLVQFKNLNENIRFHYDQKRTKEQEIQLRSIKWSNENMSEGIAGSAVYLPILYLPQGIGLLLGKLFNLSIYHSYELAKLFSLISCIFLIWISSKFYPIPALAYIFIAMPMSIFQISSSSPDGLSFSISFLIGSILIKILENKVFDKKLIYILAISLVSLVTIRINLFPIFLLIFLIFIQSKEVNENKGMFVILLSFLLSLGWIILAYKTIMIDSNGSGNFNQSGMTATDKILYFLSHKKEFFMFFVNTFLNEKEMSWQYKHFIGVLGWSDTHLEKWMYYYLTIIIFIISALTIKLNRICKDIFPFVIFFIVILFTFFILLVTWTDLSSPIIVGVQGRYFIPFAIILAYLSFIAKRNNALNYLILLFLISSSLFTINSLIYRYYIG